MRRAPSPSLRRGVEALASAAWIGFLAWSVLAAIVWASGVGETEVQAWLQRHFPHPEGGTVGFRTPLGSALDELLALVDPVWVALAAVHCYASVAASEGLERARRWSLAILLLSFVLAASSAAYTRPQGAIHFTDRLGPQLLGVPLGLPLLWCVVIFGARQGVRRLWKNASHRQVAIATGLLAAGAAWLLEPVASHERVWWLRDGAVAVAPLCATWALAGGGLAWAFRSGGEAGRREGGRAAVVFAILNGLCLLARFGGAFRR